MQGKRPITFIRHGESEYNLAQIQASSGTTEVRMEDENLEIKYSPNLIDCPLSQKGIQQCLDKREIYRKTPVHVVIVSPLLRAIETAHYMFKDHPSQPIFLVEPQLEALLSTCDVGGNLEFSMKKFSYVDFSRVLDQPGVSKFPNLWNLVSLLNRDMYQKAIEYIERKALEETGDINNNILNTQGPSYLTEYMKSLYPDFLEGFFDTKQRVQDSKEILHNLIQKYPSDYNIVCVAHSRYIATLTGTEFADNFDVTNGKWIHNCEAVSYEV